MVEVDRGSQESWHFNGSFVQRALAALHRRVTTVTVNLAGAGTAAEQAKPWSCRALQRAWRAKAQADALFNLLLLVNMPASWWARPLHTGSIFQQSGQLAPTDNIHTHAS